LIRRGFHLLRGDAFEIQHPFLSSHSSIAAFLLSS
jgi:hypothetical protein